MAVGTRASEGTIETESLTPLRRRLLPSQRECSCPLVLRNPVPPVLNYYLRDLKSVINKTRDGTSNESQSLCFSYSGSVTKTRNDSPVFISSLKVVS